MADAVYLQIQAALNPDKRQAHPALFSGFRDGGASLQ